MDSPKKFLTEEAFELYYDSVGVGDIQQEAHKFAVENQGVERTNWRKGLINYREILWRPWTGRRLSREMPLLYFDHRDVAPTERTISSPSHYLSVIEEYLEGVLPKWLLKLVMYILFQRKDRLPSFVLAEADTNEGRFVSLHEYAYRTYQPDLYELKEEYLEQKRFAVTQGLTPRQVQLLNFIPQCSSEESLVWKEEFNRLCTDPRNHLPLPTPVRSHIQNAVNDA